MYEDINLLCHAHISAWPKTKVAEVKLFFNILHQVLLKMFKSFIQKNVSENKGILLKILK